MEERGYFLCRGDRRGFVALDVDGKAYAIPKWTGLKAEEVRAKLGDPNNLPSVDETQSLIKSKVSDQMRGFMGQINDRQRDAMHPLREQVDVMTKAHRKERQTLKDGQERRWAQETRTRSDRLNKGVRGLFDRLSGKAKATQKINEREAVRAAKRDQKQRDFMVIEQMKERQKMQREINKLRRKQKEERKLFAHKVRQALNMTPTDHGRDRTRTRTNHLSL